MLKILYFDIESAPNVGYTWQKWEQNVIEFVEESYMLCYAYAWNDGKVKVVSLKDFDGYSPGLADDKALTASLWELFNEADVIVAHNAKGFDIKYSNGRFLKWQLVPPTTYQVIDTLLISRSKFKLNSNKLDDVAKHLNLKGKAETGGFALWKGCMKGDMVAWAKMCRYNKQDVVLLRQVYYRLRAWMTTHPSLAYGDLRPHCTLCGSVHVQKRGMEMRGNAESQRWKCNNPHCGANLYTSLKCAMPLKAR